MAGSFFGLNISIRGLYSAQRGLDVVNHNISNVNTPGYSRQQAVQTASQPLSVLDGTGMIGTGSEVNSVKRIRDEYLDYKYWSENVTQGEWDKKTELMSEVEATFNEPSNSGFATVMNDFYNSLQSLAKDPSSKATRSIVKEKAVVLAKYFNNTSAHFDKLQADVNDQIKTKVDEVNSLGVQIEELNRQIYSAELTGNIANDLRDQRTNLVDKLSKIVNIQAGEVTSGKLPDGRDDKHFVISISGKNLVDHYSISKLAFVPRTAGSELNKGDVPSLYEVKWADGNTIDIKGGEIKGCLDVRDGNEGSAPDASYTGTETSTPVFKGIPYYRKKLDEFVQQFAKSFNEGFGGSPGHADGYILSSTTADTTPSGIRFFTMLDSSFNPMSSATFVGGSLATPSLANYANITAKNFTVSSDIISDSGNIAVSSSGGQVGNIDNLNSILSLRNNTHIFAEGAPEDFMKSLVSTLGVDSQEAKSISANQDAIIKQLDNRRLSDSGVSVDEEMTNLVKYQHAYNASAKMIQTMTEIYDTLINRLGV
ncbi:MAG TPA: flagellar hook-associated protein FlgK [Clostridia bacterium]